MNQVPHSFSRRQFLQTGGILSAAAVVGLTGRSAAASGVEILETKVISQQPEFYHGWPTVIRRKNGELWVTFSGGREAHICPFGQVCAMTSKDDGATWGRSRILHDGPLDDRDSGAVETAKGTL